ncbi:MAG: hypothetical protein WA624_18650 [Methylocella sp.]
MMRVLMTKANWTRDNRTGSNSMLDAVRLALILWKVHHRIAGVRRKHPVKLSFPTTQLGARLNLPLIRK